MSDILKACEVSLNNLRFRLTESDLPGESFEDISVCCGIIGQDRAMEAMELGLEMTSKGYNVFVTGISGTGRTTAVRLLLDKFKELNHSELKDICYVNNFRMPEQPTVLYFEAGKGRKFRKAIAYLIDSLSVVIPKIFASQNYRERRQRIIKEFESRQQELFKDFESEIKDAGFALVQMQIANAVRPDLHPVIEGQPVSFDDLETAVEEQKFDAGQLETLKIAYDKLSIRLRNVSDRSKKISGDLEEELEKLDTSMVVPLINDKVDTLKNIHKDEKTRDYLDDLNEVLIDALDLFHASFDLSEDPVAAAKIRGFFASLTVNLLVDNSEADGRPIIIEDFHSYKNLFGSIERIYDPTQGWNTDFTHIRSGSILQANGGYLILHADDIFRDPNVWPMLKRTLRTGKLAISNIDTLNRAGSGLRPEPVDLSVKVILVGEARVYNLLYEHDPDFKKIFKIKAEFDSVMDNNDKGLREYAEYVRKVVDDEDLPPFDLSGLAAVTEHGVRISGRKDKLSTRFTKIADVVKEAAWLAGKNSQDRIDRAMVKLAIKLQRERINLVETKIHELYERDIMLIELTGAEVGQINGLSVYSLGEYSFGRPTRITATVSPGSAGVINIEREAALSGQIHDKGVLILTGFMRRRFGRTYPLVLTASLCFEQSYGGVDGDSASSTEIYALLSALTDIPLKQNIAVTGSVNQHGEIQPIGGVNEKIEGFFDVCQIDGLTGDQGVLIPKQNVQDVILRDDVLDAIEAGKFHVYAIDHVDQGIEILTGVEAGDMQDDGTFPLESINHRAQMRLKDLADIWREYIRSGA